VRSAKIDVGSARLKEARQVTRVGWRSKWRRLTDIVIRKKLGYRYLPGYRQDKEEIGLSLLVGLLAR
jgi:hypothetical protein